MDLPSSGDKFGGPLFLLPSAAAGDAKAIRSQVGDVVGQREGEREGLHVYLCATGSVLHRVNFVSQ